MRKKTAPTKPDPTKPAGIVSGYAMFPEPDGNGAVFVRPEHADAYGRHVRREQIKTKVQIFLFVSILALMVLAMLVTPFITYLLVHPTK